MPGCDWDQGFLLNLKPCACSALRRKVGGTAKSFFKESVEAKVRYALYPIIVCLRSTCSVLCLLFGYLFGEAIPWLWCSHDVT